MGYQRVTLSDLRTQLLALLKSNGTFWTQEEVDAAINEAIAAWQLMTGESISSVALNLSSTLSNLWALNTTNQPLSIISVSDAQGTPLRELSIVELDQGFYGWRTEIITSSLQGPSYWAPIGIKSIMIYPRAGNGSQNLSMQCYSDAVPLAATNSYIDIDESYLTRILAYAQSLLAFKQGVGDGTDNAKPLKELFLAAAQGRNQLLMETALYKNYMGQDDSKGEPAQAEPQQGARG